MGTQQVFILMPNHTVIFLKTLSVAVKLHTCCTHNIENSPEVMSMTSHDQATHTQERNCVTAEAQLTAMVKMILTVRLISGMPMCKKNAHPRIDEIQ